MTSQGKTSDPLEVGLIKRKGEHCEKTRVRADKDRLARECAKLDLRYEQALAEEGIHFESPEWPEY